MAVDRNWTRAPLDMLSHAHAHLREGSESALRHSLVGFDQAVEGTITAFLRYGPGSADASDAAEKARRPGSNFWAKVSFLEGHLLGRAARLEVPLEEVTRIHDTRNDVQHDGRWIVPPPADVDTARRSAVSIFQALDGRDVSLMFGPVEPERAQDRVDAFELPPMHWALLTPSAASPAPSVISEAERRRLGPKLYGIARVADPQRAGIHYTRLTRLLQQGNEHIGGANLDRNRLLGPQQRARPVRAARTGRLHVAGAGRPGHPRRDHRQGPGGRRLRPLPRLRP